LGELVLAIGAKGEMDKPVKGNVPGPTYTQPLICLSLLEASKPRRINEFDSGAVQCLNSMFKVYSIYSIAVAPSASSHDMGENVPRRSHPVPPWTLSSISPSPPASRLGPARNILKKSKSIESKETMEPSQV